MNNTERRWRLLLGKLSDKSLASCELDKQDLNRQSALDYLYHRQYQNRGRVMEGESKQGGDESSDPVVLEWLSKLPALFPEAVCETLRHDALEKFEMTALLTDPETLSKIEPNQQLLQSLLMLKGKMSQAVLDQLRQIIKKVVEDITQRLKIDVDSAFSGRRNRFSRSPQKIANNFDWQRTLKANLKNYDQQSKQLVISQLYFNRRIKQRLPWDVILCVDQSGSMAASVIYSAIMAGILSGLPAINVHLVVFDTQVVDLTAQAQDPVETLMTVQLGGGTDIGKAMQYCESLVINPHRSVIALISDFYEGGNEKNLLVCTQRLVGAKVTLLGLASLDEQGGSDYDHQMATKLADLGMHVGAMTPHKFADWLAGVMDK